jgi:outer membrane protein
LKKAIIPTFPRSLDMRVVLGLLSLTLAGCATSALETSPERPDRPWKPMTDESGEILTGQTASGHSGDAYVLPSNQRLAEAPAALALDRSRKYSLPELIDLAQSYNPLTRVAWNAAREAALAAGIAKSAYLPRLSAAAVAGHQTSSSETTASFASTSASATAKGIVSTVSLQWLLFDFGRREALVDAATQGSVIANIAFTAAHQKVIHDVSLSFYSDVAARKRLANATIALKNARLIETAADERMKRGIGTSIEVAQARQGTAQARLGLVHAGGEARDSRLRLLSAMGISPVTEIEIADLSDRMLSPQLADAAEKSIPEALARRPDILAAYAGRKASRAELRAAEAEFLPKLFISGTGAYNSGTIDVSGIPGAENASLISNVSRSRFGSTALAGISVPIYDGGVRAAIMEQAQAKADNADVKLVRTREEAAREIFLVSNALRTSLVAHNASSAVSAAAQTTFDAAITAYRAGVGSVTDATAAQTQLLLARNGTSDAYYTTLAAAATLALATGSLGEAPYD